MIVCYFLPKYYKLINISLIMDFLENYILWEISMFTHKYLFNYCSWCKKDSLYINIKCFLIEIQILLNFNIFFLFKTINFIYHILEMTLLSIYII